MWFYIRMLVLMVLSVFVFAFAKKRNENRKVSEVVVHFEAGQNLYITQPMVNKLLIQSRAAVTGGDKELLVLKELEKRLDDNAMIARADVYLSLDGKLNANITQRKPLARLNAATPYYLDESGRAMPLSVNYSARVPLVSGIDAGEEAEVYPLLRFIKEDNLLNRQVVGVEREQNGDYVLSLRVMDYKIKVGKVKDLQVKFNNYKAFCQKAQQDTILNDYKWVDLRFKGQVVGTKIKA